MAEHNLLGNRGEEAAIGYLINKGYRVLEKNWHYQKAEIDIIAQKGETLAVVEVKTRGSDLFESPEEAVKKGKIRRVIQAADQYITEKDLDVEVRFDIIGLQFKDGRWEIQHLEGAFESYF